METVFIAACTVLIVMGLIGYISQRKHLVEAVSLAVYSYNYAGALNAETKPKPKMLTVHKGDVILGGLATVVNLNDKCVTLLFGHEYISDGKTAERFLVIAGQDLTVTTTDKKQPGPFAMTFSYREAIKPGEDSKSRR